MKFIKYIINILPIVVRCDGMKLLSQKRNRMLVLPTPESPMIKSLTSQS